MTYAGLQPTDRAAARNLRVYSGENRKTRLRPNGAGDWRGVRHQVAQRRHVPSQSAQEILQRERSHPPGTGQWEHGADHRRSVARRQSDWCAGWRIAEVLSNVRQAAWPAVSGQARRPAPHDLKPPASAKWWPFLAAP